MRHRALHITILLALGCSDSGTTPVVEERIPTSIVLDESEVVLDDGGAVQLRAELRDQRGERFETLPPGVTLRWSSSDSVVASVTDGLVSAQRPGTAKVTVNVGDLHDDATVRVRAVPIAVEPAGESGQRATPTTAGAVFPESLSVRVLDRHGNGVPGIPVEFTVRAGGGRISPETPTTGVGGSARVAWTLGTGAGRNTAAAVLSGLSPATFEATGIPGAAAALAIVSGNDQSGPAGEALPLPLLVEARDRFGNRVGGVSIRWSGNGSFDPSSGATGADGRTQTRWTLGDVGMQSAAAEASGTPGAEFTATATRAPTASTTPATSITTTSTVLNGTVNPQGSPTVAWFEWGTSTTLAPSAPNSPLQLAGKIEARWAEIRTEPLSVINHGVGWTATGSGRSPRSSPGARTVVDDVTRFEAEVLGEGYPWSGGETSATYFPEGPIRRVNAFTPGPDDFVYISLGTNDPSDGISTSETIANLEWMVDQWVAAGLPAEHLIVTTLAPRSGTSGQSFPQINDGIRAMASRRGVHLIDLAAHASDDNGLTWRSGSLHVGGDSTHYAESVRDWLAERVVEYVARNAP